MSMTLWVQIIRITSINTEKVWIAHCPLCVIIKQKVLLIDRKSEISIVVKKGISTLM